MKKITKYKLTSSCGEREFETTKIIKTVNILKITEKTGTYGDPISFRTEPKRETFTEYYEGIKAISLPSREPAEVEILETKDTNEIDINLEPPKAGLSRKHLEKSLSNYDEFKEKKIKTYSDEIKWAN